MNVPLETMNGTSESRAVPFNARRNANAALRRALDGLSAVPNATRCCCKLSIFILPLPFQLIRQPIPAHSAKEPRYGLVMKLSEAIRLLWDVPMVSEPLARPLLFVNGSDKWPEPISVLDRSYLLVAQIPTWRSSPDLLVRLGLLRAVPTSCVSLDCGSCALCLASPSWRGQILHAPL